LAGLLSLLHGKARRHLSSIAPLTTKGKQQVSRQRVANPGWDAARLRLTGKKCTSIFVAESLTIFGEGYVEIQTPYPARYSRSLD
jgi:hypothetical protein